MADQTQALSFGAAAAEYDRFRPSYPVEAVRWAVGTPPPAEVVDLGAGTGKLTRVLLSAGYQVTPVEPDAGMRDQLAASTGGVTALAGFAEAVPLPDGAAEAVVAGQAYHWFDRERAHPEIARLLRDGGHFGAIWNHRDDREPWVAELSRITHDVAENRGHFDPEPTVSLELGDSFGPVERKEFTHREPRTPESLVAMISTRSYFLTASAEKRAEIVAGVRELTATHPDLAGRESFDVPYRVIVFRSQVLRS
ncbi:class I SAM-dependent methyltransferase [Phytohabitans sp. ZYX-F-186]|uniref:Class I SAM-dependent methyltransferase n=1 Tax=Phytohabitans maris TaxID=3071409 RepID=A0ABU0ZIS8_9ACTN|nr:class I SAM-dependent methyltransferase [Phytohabitans sp. ZYX-F-186]MDQ7906963.1 class I SAM-dependent methyltransferase [Phytohabitans sp. ZYX-F-186]